MTAGRSTRSKLSVCLIARDEARHLPGCLESVRDWADEVILIDTGSTDRTPDIARRVGARVHSLGDWAGDFSAARNSAIDRASGDWILFVDCDERLDYISGGRLPRWISSLDTSGDACFVRILTPAGSGSKLHLQSWSPRLVRREPGLRFKGALFERLYRGAEPVPVSEAIDVTIYHVGFADPDRTRARRRRQFTVDPAEHDQPPPDAAGRLQLANHYVAAGECGRAQGHYHVLLAERGLGDIRPLVHWNLAIANYRAGDLKAALDQLERAADEFPALKGSHRTRAEILMEAGRFEEAESYLDRLLESDDVPGNYPDLPASLPLLLVFKGACRLARDDRETALALFDEALARDQGLFAGHDRRADLLAALGRKEEALSSYLRAAALRPDSGRVRLKAGLLLLELGKREDGLAFLREAARLDPEVQPAARSALAQHESGEKPMPPAAAEPPSPIVTAEPMTAPEAVEPAASPQSGVPAAAPVPIGSHEEAIPADRAITRLSAPPAPAPASDAPASVSDETVEAGEAASETCRLSICALLESLEDLHALIPGRTEAVDEIVIGLTGPALSAGPVPAGGGTAGTPSLPDRGAGFRTVPCSGLDDEAAARNAVLEAARGEWILFLEAGDRLSSTGLAPFVELIASSRADAFRIPIRSSGAETILSPLEEDCRLFRRRPDACYSGPFFPRILPGLAELGYAVAAADVAIDRPAAADPAAVARRRRTAAALELELTRRPGDHERQFQLGLLTLYLGDPDGAEPILRAAIRPTGKGLPPEWQALALAHLARCALDRNDLTEAARDARAALSLNPDSARARHVLATVAYRHQHFTEASQEFRRTFNVPKGPEAEGLSRPEISREMGVCLYRAEKFDEAAEAFAFAAADRPADALGRLFLGNALAHLGRFEAAYKAFQEAVEIDPELTDARGNLEVMAKELGYRLFDAGRLAEALALVPPGTHHIELLFLQAICQHGLNELGAARKSLELLNSLDDNFSEAHWNLALICRELGDRAAARRALARFRQLAPGDKRAVALEEALLAHE